MAFDGDACRVDDDGGAVGCFGLLRALRVIWTLQLNSFPKVGQAEKKELEKYDCKTQYCYCWPICQPRRPENCRAIRLCRRYGWAAWRSIRYSRG